MFVPGFILIRRLLPGQVQECATLGAVKQKTGSGLLAEFLINLFPAAGCGALQEYRRASYKS